MIVCNDSNKTWNADTGQDSKVIYKFGVWSLLSSDNSQEP